MGALLGEKIDKMANVYQALKSTISFINIADEKIDAPAVKLLSEGLIRLVRTSWLLRDPPVLAPVDMVPSSPPMSLA